MVINTRSVVSYKQSVKGYNGASFGDHGVLEGDRVKILTRSLKWH